MRISPLLASSTILFALACSVLASGAHSLGIPISYRGMLIGCAEQPTELAGDLIARFGDQVVYFFGLRGCPECIEMEKYLGSLLPSGLAYVDVLENSDLFTKLLSYLSKYVEEEYLREVPIVLVRKGTSVVAISIGLYRNDSYWMSALLGVGLGTCEVRVIKPTGQDPLKLVVGALLLGAASALSPCVIYLYSTLLFLYAAYGARKSLLKLLSFVVGLGIGYFLVIIGLYSLLWLLRPFTWVFFLAFGLYMVLHSRGVLGCLIGGRACRDISYPMGNKVFTVLGSFFPVLLGVVASISATPCSAGYFVLLQSAFAADAGPLVNIVILTYLMAYVLPYVLISILSSRFLGLVDRFMSKVSVVEFLGGVVLISMGLYLVLSS
ncbi:MAG: cytochrome c biogenesis protein CcdA [Sulfolobales archaeon]